MKRLICSGCLPLIILFVIMPLPVKGQNIRILVLDSMAPQVTDMMEQFPNLEFVSVKDMEEMAEKVSNCDAVIGWVNREIVLAAKNLRWIQSPSAGVEGFVRIPELVRSDISLTNCKIIMGPEIADHAFAMLLTLTRKMKRYVHQMDERRWDRSGSESLIELRKRTMLILGLGGIGVQIAERATAFGMHVIAIDVKDIPMMDAVDYAGKPDELHSLLPKADVIVSAVPHTRKSERMLGEDEFRRMKDRVYIINVSRGAIIDTDALVSALRSGKVAGAGLDVTVPEPLPSEHPLWTMPNVIITPHVAGRSQGMQERRKTLFRENIARFMQGLPLKNQVNKERGY
jgi:phosphoglycerate dehydrogenase-like enzyme